jgi:hypothetical protein
LPKHGANSNDCTHHNHCAKPLSTATEVLTNDGILEA